MPELSRIFRAARRWGFWFFLSRFSGVFTFNFKLLTFNLTSPQPFPHISTILSNPTPPANPFPPPTCTPLCQPCHAHSNNDIVILDFRYCFGIVLAAFAWRRKERLPLSAIPVPSRIRHSPDAASLLPSTCRRSDIQICSLHPGWGYVTFQHSSRPPLLFKPFRTNTCEARPIISALTPFRINTCKSVSKQRTLTPFRINTYEKTRGWVRGLSLLRRNPTVNLPRRWWDFSASFSLTFQHSNLQTLQLSVLRAHFQVPYPVSPLLATLTKNAGCVPKIPILELGPRHPPFGACHWPQVLSFQILAHSFAARKMLPRLFSMASALFAKNHPGWGEGASYC